MLGLDYAAVSDARAAVALGVRVEDLAPAAGERQADAVALARHRREVHDADDGLLTVLAPAREGQHRVLGVVGLDPLERRRIVLALPHRRLLAVGVVEVADQPLDPRV